MHRTQATKLLTPQGGGDTYKNVHEFVASHVRAQKVAIQDFVLVEQAMKQWPLTNQNVGTPAHTQALQRQKALRQKRKDMDAGILTTEELLDSHPGLMPGEADPGEAIALPRSKSLISPAEYGLRLMVISGIAESEDQYLASIWCIAPLQRLWEYANNQGRLDDFNSRASLIRLLADAPFDISTSIFVHGAGGSGKTYLINAVIWKLYEHFCPGIQTST